MLNLKLQVFQENDIIKIRIEVIFDNLLNKMAILNIQDKMFFIYSKQDVVTSLLINRKSSSSINFQTSFEDKEIEAVVGTSIYDLPKDPQMMLDFLLAFTSWVKEMQFDRVLFNDFSILNKLTNLNNKRTLSIPLDEYLSGEDIGKSSPVEKLAEQIVKLKNVSGYEETHQTLSTLYEYNVKNLQTTFADCLCLQKRFHILMEIKPDLRTNRTLFVLAVAKKLISEGRKKELNYFIDNFNREEKIKLFESCIGKVASDGGNYHWKHLEWGLLQYAQFSIRSDKRVSIKLQYKDGYLGGYLNYWGYLPNTHLKIKMQHLAPIIGLEFAEDSDFIDEIIFTPACSKKLIAAGLHINREYLKNILKAEQTWGFFKHANTVQDQATGNPNYFNRLPQELMSYIVNEANANNFEKLDSKDASAVMQIAFPRMR